MPKYYLVIYNHPIRMKTGGLTYCSSNLFASRDMAELVKGRDQSIVEVEWTPPKS